MTDAERAARYRTALIAIRTLCEQAVFGGWRHRIAAIVDSALSK